MTGIAAGGAKPETPVAARRRRRAAGIYGAIITAAILDAVTAVVSLPVASGPLITPGG